MRGYIKKLYKTSYTIVVPLGKDPATGKYKQHWENIRGTKVEAERRLAELQNEIYKGSFVKPQKLTVAEYLIDWIENTARFQVSPRTYQGYEYVIKKHLINGIGRHYLSSLNGSIIQKYYAKKLTDARLDGKDGALSARTVRSHHRILHRALKSAVVKRLISSNPCDNTEPPVPINKEVHSMTNSQLKEFIVRLKGSPYYELFYTSLFTGLRRSEILALRWQDIDLLNGYLTVNRSLHQIAGQFVFCEPKTEKSKATISLTTSTISVLENYKQRKVAEYILMGKELKEADLAFCRLDGTPIPPHTISQYWRRFADRIGMSGIRLHDARHTHATLMIKQGVNIKVVQERLRHKNIETTLGIYSHVLPGMQEEAAKIFDDEFAPEQSLEKVY
ncbi:MAG: site-specific integrase [Dehalococcoidia bacterium]|nr:site-specific integrase [Dehalococcoidia bacterium]